MHATFMFTACAFDMQNNELTCYNLHNSTAVCNTCPCKQIEEYYSGLYASSILNFLDGTALIIQFVNMSDKIS